MYLVHTELDRLIYLMLHIPINSDTTANWTVESLCGMGIPGIDFRGPKSSWLK